MVLPTHRVLLLALRGFDLLSGCLAPVLEDRGKRFDAVDQRFGEMDRRIDRVGGRLDRIDLRLERMNDRFAALQRRIVLSTYGITGAIFATLIAALIKL